MKRILGSDYAFCVFLILATYGTVAAFSALVLAVKGAIQ